MQQRTSAQSQRGDRSRQLGSSPVSGVRLWPLGGLLLLLLSSGCREKSETWDEAREQSQAKSFVATLNTLAEKEQWTELSRLFAPDLRCKTAACVIAALTAATDCERRSAGRIWLDESSLKLFHHGDGFSVPAKVLAGRRACSFTVEVLRKDGWGPYQISYAQPQ